VRKWHRPVTIKGVKLRGGRGRPHELAVRFSSDLAGGKSPVPLEALVLTPVAGEGAISQDVMEVSYDRGTGVATWTFPRLDGGVLPAGRYQLKMLAEHIFDDLGNHLNGTSDGQPGHDFVSRKSIRSRG
jgi:hypothetical protein